MSIFIREINRRLDALEELCSPRASCSSSLKGLLTQLPDLERGLCTIYHKKVSFTFVLSSKSALINRQREQCLFSKFIAKGIIILPLDLF